MNEKRFESLINELRQASIETLVAKNKLYATHWDKLHNFRVGADILGSTPAEACWGYLTKHLVALRDRVAEDDFSDREDFLEKCKDAINYICFLWCIGNDMEDKKNEELTNFMIKEQ